jgi:NAD(P)-dependent dehydrogenase (short-subunit alcohol dehydrogenase family)
MQSDLSGKVSVVMGAGLGLGRAIADRFAASGARVVYVDVDPEAAAAAAATSQSPDAVGIGIDVSRSGAAAELFERVVADWGSFDLFVNLAGTVGPGSGSNLVTAVENVSQRPITPNPISQAEGINDDDPEAAPDPLDLSREEWGRFLGADLAFVHEASRAAARLLRDQGGGRLIHVAPDLGLGPARLKPVRDVLRAGIVDLTKALARELGPAGILVNAIIPGFIEDRDRENQSLLVGPDGRPLEPGATQLGFHPLRRTGTVQEIAVAALFLADPGNSYLNGQVLVVDGGANLCSQNHF